MTTSGSFTYGNAAVSSPCVSCGVVLPIELISFDVTVNSETVVVGWSTATESNNDFFTIERSTDGENYSAIGTIDGVGNSITQMDYTFIDREPILGTSYYRLLQTDFDGSTTASAIRVLNLDPASIMNTISAFPNPTQNSITLIGSKIELTEIRVLDGSGKQLTHQVSVTRKSDSQVEIDMSSLQSGIYMIQTQTQIKRVIKK